VSLVVLTCRTGGPALCASGPAARSTLPALKRSLAPAMIALASATMHERLRKFSSSRMRSWRG
jgi:hypothetical protein